MEEQWFDGDNYSKSYDEELNQKFSLGTRSRKSAASARKSIRKSIDGHVINTVKIERKMNKYLAGEEEGRRRLADAKIRCAASADLIAKALAAGRHTDPIERLKKFNVNLLKHEQREAKRTKNKSMNDTRRSFQLLNFGDDQEQMESIPDPFDSSKGLKYASRSAVGDVSFNRALELKELLEERERYFNGEMDDAYYKIGPDGNSMPSPPNVRIKSARSLSSCENIAVDKNCSKSLDLIYEEQEHKLHARKIITGHSNQDDLLNEQILRNSSSMAMFAQSFPRIKKYTLPNRQGTYGRSWYTNFEHPSSASKSDLQTLSSTEINQENDKNDAKQELLKENDRLMEKNDNVYTLDTKSEPVTEQNSVSNDIHYQKNTSGAKPLTLTLRRRNTPLRAIKTPNKSKISE